MRFCMSTFVNHSLGGFVEDGDVYVVTSDKAIDGPWSKEAHVLFKISFEP